MRRTIIVLKLATLATSVAAAVNVARAQSPELAAGDAAYREHRGAEAIAHYEAAFGDTASRFVALCKASRAEVDVAESGVAAPVEDSLLAAARAHAEQAIALMPSSPDGHFALARALGRKALSLGTMDRIRYSKLIYAEATAAIAADSTHAGALHVLGMWNAEVMRVNGFARMVARTFLGAQLFGKANWADAQRLLEEAVRLEPVRIVHHLDLAGVYKDRGDRARAKAEYEWIAAAPPLDFNDDIYKRLAAERLKRL